MSDKATEVLLGVVLPVLLVGVILLADAIEGPKTAYVGVLAVVPMLAAVFARPLLTFIVGAIAWTAAFTFGHFASDGNVTAQTVRLIIIGLSTLAAVGAATLRMRREAKLGAALEEAGHAETLRIQAESDSLTGLLNRRGLLRLLESGGTATTRTLTLMDCDKLKIINDEYGHLAGDEFLRALAGRVRSNLASQDHIGRWGGDEFLVVQALSVDQAVGTILRLRESINAPAIQLPSGPMPASVSIGVAEWVPGQAFDDALAAADRALYRAKSAGGNRVEVSDETVGKGLAERS
ncbi:MAG: GGDEF domain-containing protein [Actinomycetes bacterium]